MIWTLRGVLFRKVTLIGVGLLGGSLGLALRQRGLAGSVHGYVRRAASVADCRQAGAVDEATTDLAAATREADLVVFSTPIGQMRGLAELAAPALKRGALVTDVGSVKGGVVAELEPLCASAGAHFIGSHPMAGSEKAGVGAARSDLFEGAVCAVTPTPQSDAAALAKIEALWSAVGAGVLRLSPAAHDELVARASHLPQAVAVSLASLVLDPAAAPEQARLCAGGFRDCTRIASGSPEMWRDILLANRQPVAQAIDDFIARLRNLQSAVAAGNAEAITELLRSAKGRRDAWMNHRAVRSPAE